MRSSSAARSTVHAPVAVSATLLAVGRGVECSGAHRLRARRRRRRALQRLEPAGNHGHIAPRMELSVRIERWPLAGAFTISRGSKTEAVVVVAELSDGIHRGRGESVPYARYGETPDGIVAAIEAMRPALQQGLDRAALQRVMPPGAARNALDCAYWDVNAKQTGCRAHDLAGLARRYAGDHGLYDFARLGRRNGGGRGSGGLAAACSRSSSAAGDDDGKRIAAVRRAAPRAELIVDANEGWDADNLAAQSGRLRRCRRHADRAAVAGRRATKRWRRSSGRFRSAPMKACTIVRRSMRLPASTTPSTSSSTRPAA